MEYEASQHSEFLSRHFGGFYPESLDNGGMCVEVGKFDALILSGGNC
jgi:hypothetical protein